MDMGDDMKSDGNFVVSEVPKRTLWLWRFLPWKLWKALRLGYGLLYGDANRGLELYGKTVWMALGFKVYCYPRRFRKEWMIARKAMTDSKDECLDSKEAKRDEQQTETEDGQHPV